MFLHLSVILFTGGCVCHGDMHVGGTVWQTPPTPGKHPLWVDIPSGRHPPGQTPARQTPPSPVHAGIHTPLPSACWDTHPLHSACLDTANKRAVRIQLECILDVNAIRILCDSWSYIIGIKPVFSPKCWEF